MYTRMSAPFSMENKPTFLASQRLQGRGVTNVNALPIAIEQKFCGLSTNTHSLIMHPLRPAIEDSGWWGVK